MRRRIREPMLMRLPKRAACPGPNTESFCFVTCISIVDQQGVG